MEQKKSSIISIKVMPILMVFLVMGFGDVVGTLVGFAKEEFQLSNAMAQLIPMMGFIMFGILSVPTGILQDKIGKKNILLIAMAIALIGMVIPLFGLQSYGLLLLSIFFLGAGNTVMQVAGNPIMRDVSAPGRYSRNLSLGQFVKAIGSLSGPVLPVVALTWFDMGWKVLFPVYSILIFITVLSVSTLKINESASEKEEKANFKSCFALLKNKYVLLMVMAIFLYVGAEVSMNSGIATYLNNRFGFDLSSMATLGIGFFFVSLMVGRFLGAIILNWLNAKKFFIITTVISIISLMALFVPNQTVAIIAIFVTGLGFANIFPLVFSILIDSMPDRSNELSGLLVMAIVGGAIMPFIMGVVADLTSVMAGFLVPLASMFYILFTALRTRKTD